MKAFPCNCGHSVEDHLHDYGNIGMDFGWCIFSEFGQCPCDNYIAMDNLEFVEWYHRTKLIDKEAVKGYTENGAEG